WRRGGGSRTSTGASTMRSSQRTRSADLIAASSSRGDMAQVETVLGSIDSGQLGFTLSHEHVYVIMGEDNHHYPWMFDLDATRDTAIRELSEAKAGGVDTVIDL